MSYQFKCGMYGGCFNPLHLGHVRDMIKAANMCEKLIVVICHGINRAEIDVNTRYRWVYETVKHYPNVKVMILRDTHRDKHLIPEDEWLKQAEEVKAFAGETITAVFHGDDYGEKSVWSKCYPEAKKVIFKRDYMNSTSIRDNPFECWDWLPDNVRPYYVKRVLISGIESTGKSVLTTALARHFNTNYLEEVGRDLSQLSGTCELMLPEDYNRILIEHKDKANHLYKEANKVFFSDTDAAYTRFFLQYVDGGHDTANINLAKAIEATNSYDLILYLQPTVAFVQDGDRRLEVQEERDKASKWYFNELLLTYGARTPVVQISEPTYNGRFVEAVEAVKKVLK